MLDNILFVLSLQNAVCNYTHRKSPFDLTTCQVCNSPMWLVLATYYCIEHHNSISHIRKIGP